MERQPVAGHGSSANRATGVNRIIGGGGGGREREGEGGVGGRKRARARGKEERGGMEGWMEGGREGRREGEGRGMEGDGEGDKYYIHSSITKQTDRQTAYLCKNVQKHTTQYFQFSGLHSCTS